MTTPGLTGVHVVAVPGGARIRAVTIGGSRGIVAKPAA